MECVLRPWRAEDAGDLAAALNDRGILDNLRDGLPYSYTRGDAADFIAAMGAADPHKTCAFAITVEGRAVGSISFTRQENIHCRTAEMGYYIARACWGRGVATSAVSARSFVPWAILAWKAVSPCGETAAPTAWPVCACAPRRRSNTERSAGARRAATARSCPNKRRKEIRRKKRRPRGLLFFLLERGIESFSSSRGRPAVEKPQLGPISTWSPKDTVAPSRITGLRLAKSPPPLRSDSRSHTRRGERIQQRSPIFPRSACSSRAL